MRLIFPKNRNGQVNQFLKFFVLILIPFSLSACVPGDGTHTNEKLAGFFWGYWHGLIAPVSLIISFFKPHIGIYEIHNNGFWYNLAYYVAIISGFGAMRLTRGRDHSEK